MRVTGAPPDSLSVLKGDDTREVGGFEATSWNISQKPGRVHGRASSETLSEKTPLFLPIGLAYHAEVHGEVA